MNETIFLQSAIQQFLVYKLLAEKTFAQLQEDAFIISPMRSPIASPSTSRTCMVIC